MITYLETSVFDSPAQTLVNTVNTVGVMGKGIAKEFKERYPTMFREYKKLCDENQLRVGNLHLWRTDNRWVLNFPTKTTWRQPSRLEYITSGLEKFVASYARLGITSISFPPLGCGNGNLNWADVRPVMERYLSKVNITVYIHDFQVPKNFVPEHLSDVRAPESFTEFWSDISSAIRRNKGTFYTTLDGSYAVENIDETGILINKSGHRRRIDRDLVEDSWLALRDRCLTNRSFTDDNTRKLKSYLFPILADLPYVHRAATRTVGENSVKSEGLFINRESYVGFSGPSRQAQGCLSL
ncbi:macro domain-containing protein [uncultured Devosia sp.]|uniref:macro domain-containing protein n=1 Tax=uncultured Devosia sp. TaxID=211434 RepID=UPI0026137102|nr:macro domain-containing protein [uncultured Devosia sp.]